MDFGTRVVLCNVLLCFIFLVEFFRWRANMGLRGRLDAMQSHSTAQQRKKQRCVLSKNGLVSLCAPDGRCDGIRSILEDNFNIQKTSLSLLASSSRSSALQRTSLAANPPSVKFNFARNDTASMQHTYDPLHIAHPRSLPHDTHRETEDANLVSGCHSSDVEPPTVEGAARTLCSLRYSSASVREPLAPVAVAADALVSLHGPPAHAVLTDALVFRHDMPAQASTDTLASLCEPSRQMAVVAPVSGVMTSAEATASMFPSLPVIKHGVDIPRFLSCIARIDSAPPLLPGPPGETQEVEVSKPVPYYRQLLRRSHASDDRTRQLRMEIDQKAALLESLRRTRKALNALNFRGSSRKEETPTSAVFTPLSKEEEEEVQQALNGANRHEVLVRHEGSNIDLTRGILQCLKPGVWLNDEVINLYMELLKERERRDSKSFSNCHFFNTFFFNKLYKDARSYDYKAVRRWTTQRKLGYSLLDCDKIFVPIHKDIHWCLAVINLKEKKIHYLDSLKGHDGSALQVLARYMKDEAKDKLNENSDADTWDLECLKDIPEQMNGCDCGMFMIKYADFLSCGNDLNFSQEHMEYFRKRTVLELLQLKVR